MLEKRRLLAILPDEGLQTEELEEIARHRLNLEFLFEAKTDWNQVATSPPDYLLVRLDWLKASLTNPGKDPVKTLRQQKGWQNVQVLLAFPADFKGNVYTYAAHEFLPMPFNPAQIRSCIRRIATDQQTVLFADSSAGVCNIMKESFSNQPLRFFTTLDGEAAMKLILEEFPQLVFLDLSLGGLDGRQLLSLMKQNPYTRRIGVVLTSDSVDVETVEACLEQGILHFVMKPYDEAEILLMTDFFLERLNRNAQSIMVVDDSLVTLKLLTEFLERENFQVTSYTDAKEALENAIQNPPDLITADYFMPGMDGWEFCRQLKRNPKTRQIPVVMISSGSGELSYRKARILKVDDYIVKPFKENSLTYTINSVLLKRRIMQDESNRQEIERELNLGIQIQSGMLPANHATLKGCLEVHAWWEPARQLGGDFFDYRFDVRENSHMVAVADVSGKGMSSALMASAGMASLRSAAAFTASPKNMLECLNQFILEAHQNDRFITCFAALIDSQTMTVRYASAGHNGMYLFRGDGSIEKLSAQGLPCGMLQGEDYEEKSVAVRPGDRLILFSDGIFEAMDSNHQFYGRERFEERIRGGRNLGPDRFFRHLKTDVENFADARQRHDDITLLVASFLETE